MNQPDGEWTEETVKRILNEAWSKTKEQGSGWKAIADVHNRSIAKAVLAKRQELTDYAMAECRKLWDKLSVK